MSKEEFINAVENEFKEYDYTEKEIKEYFSQTTTKQILDDAYSNYTSADKEKSSASTPQAVASCLDMMY